MTKILSAIIILMLLSPTISQACLTSSFPNTLSGSCTMNDSSMIIYLDGVSTIQVFAQTSSDPPPLHIVTAASASHSYDLAHGNHTCQVKCLGPTGWYEMESGSAFIDRSATQTVPVAAYEEGTCGTAKITGSASFTPHNDPNQKHGTINIYIDGNLAKSYDCIGATTCSYSLEKLEMAQGLRSIMVKAADVLGPWNDSTIQFVQDWAPVIDTAKPIGPVSKCDTILTNVKFCHTNGTVRGTTTISSGYTQLYSGQCSQPMCIIELPIPAMASGKHTLWVRATNGIAAAARDDIHDFYLDEMPMLFIEPDSTNDLVEELEDSCQGRVKGDSNIAIGLFEGFSIHNNSMDQFKTKNVSCPGAVYKAQLGEGWSSSYGYGLFKNPNGSLVLKGGGIKAKTYAVSGSVYLSPTEDSTVLTKNSNGTYAITSRDGTVQSFNTAGNLTAITDRFGNSTTVSSISNHQQTVIDSNGKVVTFQYDNNDEKIQAISDPAGNVYSFGYDATTGSLTTVAAPAPSQGEARPTWQIQYDTSNLITQVTDPEGNVTKYGYDGNNKISSIVDPENFQKSFVYGTGNTSITDKNSGEWKFDYNTTTKMISAKTDPLGNKTTFAYGTNNKVSTVSRPVEGPAATPATKYVHNFQYDVNKNLVDDTGYAVHYTYDGNGNILTQTNDAITYHMGYTYDAANYDQVTSVTNYMDSPVTVTSYAYDTNGGYKRITITDPERVVTVVRRNSDGTVHDVTYGDGTVQTYAYNTNKTLQSVTGADAVKLEVSSYDNNQNPKTVKMYDKTGALKKTTNIDYDNLNRPKQQSVVGSQFNYSDQASYNKKNDTTLAIDAEGHPTSFVHNFRGQATTVTDALSKTTTLEYGANSSPAVGGVNQLTALTDANNNRSTWEYNVAGRLSKEVDALGNAIRYERYPSGLVWKVIKDTGGDIIATNTYNAMGKITGVTYLDGGWEAYTYYPGGQLLTAGNQNIAYTFEWFKNGALKKVTDSNGRTVDYNSYNGAGQRTLVTLLAGTADQKILNYTYGTSGNATGKPLTVSEAGVGTFTFGYDPLGRRNSLTYPNGIVGTYSFHPEQPDWLSGISYQGTLPITAVSYPTFDKAGNRTAKTVDSTALTYQYDAVYRLLNTFGGMSESFTYDDAGNRLTEAGQSYTIASANRLMSKPGKTYQYDYFGNTTTDGEWTYSWNSKNKLVQMSKSGMTVTFAYDPFGRRVSKTVVVGGVTTVHQYVHDDEDVVLEYVNGVLTSHSVHGPGIDEPLALVRSGGTGSGNYFYHADGLGSVLKLTDAAQNVVQSYGYDSFGKVTAVGSINQPYTYTGMEYDPETGKYFVRFRYYDADSGRFLSRDPLSFAAGDVVLTNYVGGNPVNYTDPWGLFGDGMKKGKLYLGHSDFYGSESVLEKTDRVGADKFNFVKEDHSWWSTPSMPWGIWRHFRSRDEVNPYLNIAIFSCDKDEFERLMHQGQDTFAHWDNGYHHTFNKKGKIGHVCDITQPDEFDVEPDWNRANEWTKQKVLIWDNICRGKK